MDGSHMMSADTEPGESNNFWTARRYSGGVTNAEQLALALESLGPTFVKFGQALSSRSDIVGTEIADALSNLQDNMKPFETTDARNIIEEELGSCVQAKALLSTLSSEPVAAASVGQVYKAYLEGYGPVAVKVKRPGVQQIVEADAQLLRKIAHFLEAIPNPISGRKMIQTELVNGVNEFMTRLFEELDYEREMKNAIRFSSLYAVDKGSSRHSLPKPSAGESPGIIVPEMIPNLCSKNILTMTWLDGEKLVNTGNASFYSDNIAVNATAVSEENLALLVQGIQCTLSQILETGVMHADPHGGNLLKVPSVSQSSMNGGVVKRLAYLDFGILADVPEQVRDGLVCAVSQLVFARDIDAVAALFGELRLIPQTEIDDPVKFIAFKTALEQVADTVLEFDKMSTVPSLKFDRLLEGLAGLVPMFQFQLPPYFLNNARALGTLEGMACSIQPNFNVLRVVYPFALQRLMKNPSGSPVVEKTLQSLICRQDGSVDRRKVEKLLRDASALTGMRRRDVLKDVVSSRRGRQFLRKLGYGELRRLARTPKFSPSGYNFLQL
eukprot:CAMPEP_0196827596 /NCGR_PEP_ID=MMETSP1362-20130617/94242_1 /TAXON_ID=163516 /ORGANISM="Leptocylindrus danicus, Strain CCMP1856" /LENGTH=553 /DNA_ID=CAMNT_0042208241 /DNA_START=664 /DNA_END=2325 /DNA_ORIENTATION=+